MTISEKLLGGKDMPLFISEKLGDGPYKISEAVPVLTFSGGRTFKPISISEPPFTAARRAHAEINQALAEGKTVVIPDFEGNPLNLKRKQIEERTFGQNKHSDNRNFIQ